MHKRRQIPRIMPIAKSFLRRGIYGWKFAKSGVLLFKYFQRIKRILRRLISKRRPKMKKRDKKKMKYLKQRKKRRRKRFNVDSMGGLFKRLIMKRLRKVRRKMRKRQRLWKNRHARLWFYLFPNYLTTEVFTGKRMGRGKGMVDSWWAIVKKNLIFAEFFGVHIRALIVAARKLTRIISIPVNLVIKQFRHPIYVRRQASLKIFSDCGE